MCICNTYRHIYIHAHVILFSELGNAERKENENSSECILLCYAESQGIYFFPQSLKFVLYLGIAD